MGSDELVKLLAGSAYFPLARSLLKDSRSGLLLCLWQRIGDLSKLIAPPECTQSNVEACFGKGGTARLPPFMGTGALESLSLCSTGPL